eukprot:CAMPEP_0117881024 /NCGR_PEP_ID=MMETSP0950-20121206/16552_1 /TAXON_ID=44440 /ORGANISM="Chattonella subsalsa, Strain CCMP2191" /LENGTH=138 /DNA_ID=CAMNT_0005736149 /DNA_START=316 /DNA_END=732 /DNA_ORIENTATION=-
MEAVTNLDLKISASNVNIQLNISVHAETEMFILSHHIQPSKPASACKSKQREWSETENQHSKRMRRENPLLSVCQSKSMESINCKSAVEKGLLDDKRNDNTGLLKFNYNVEHIDAEKEHDKMVLKKICDILEDIEWLS